MQTQQDPTKFKEEDKDKILKLLEHIGNDGHTIWKPEAITEAGFDEALAERFMHSYESDANDPKWMITGRDGKPREKLTGIYGLNVLEAICSDLGIDHYQPMGRGRTAQICTKAIRDHFKGGE